MYEDGPTKLNKLHEIIYRLTVVETASPFKERFSHRKSDFLLQRNQADHHKCLRLHIYICVFVGMQLFRSRSQLKSDYRRFSEYSSH